MQKTFSEKILALKAREKETIAGKIVTVMPDVVMSHDNTDDISQKFKAILVRRIYDSGRHVIVLDHCTPAATEKYAMNHKRTQEFVKEQNIKRFYDINYGKCHQVLPEEGFAVPGLLIVGSGSHTTTYGAFGTFATGIGRTETGAIFATGDTWLRVPKTMKIEITGKFQERVSLKDLAIYLTNDIWGEGAVYKAC